MVLQSIWNIIVQWPSSFPRGIHVTLLPHTIQNGTTVTWVAAPTGDVATGCREFLPVFADIGPWTLWNSYAGLKILGDPIS
jgi:hypothetical protein